MCDDNDGLQLVTSRTATCADSLSNAFARWLSHLTCGWCKMHNLSPYGKADCSVMVTTDCLIYSCNACTDAGQLVMQSSIATAARLDVIAISAFDCSACCVCRLAYTRNLKRKMPYCVKHLLYGALCSCGSSCWTYQQERTQACDLLSNLWIGMGPGHQQAAQGGQQIQGKATAWDHQHWYHGKQCA